MAIALRQKMQSKNITIPVVIGFLNCILYFFRNNQGFVNVP